MGIQRRKPYAITSTDSKSKVTPVKMFKGRYIF